MELRNQNEVVLKVFGQLKVITEKIDELGISSKPWLSIDELSVYIGLKVSTIHQYVHLRKIPSNKVPGGRKLIFKRIEIDNWIENGKTANTHFSPKIISEEIWQGVLDKNE